MIQRLHKQYIITAVLLLIAIILTRLSLLLSSASYLDGDEGLMGVMTMNALAGEGVPFFFYGAKFGIVIFEIIPLILWSKCFGLSETGMQITMLILWSVGALFLFLAVKRLASIWTATMAGILFISCPAWFRVSIAVWGYNQTGLIFSLAAIYLMVSHITASPRKSYRLWLLSLFCSIAFFSQPIYALGLLPFLGLLFYRTRTWRCPIILATGFALIATSYLLMHGMDKHYWSPSFFRNFDVIENLLALPGRFWVTMNGAYFLSQPISVGPLTHTFTAMWSLMVAYCTGSAIYRAVSRRQISFELACIFSILLVFLFSLLISPRSFGFRYLLPTVGFQAMLIALEMNHLARRYHRKLWINVATACLGLLAITASMTEYSKLSFSGSRSRANMPEKQSLYQTVRYLNDNNLHHIYSLGAMFQWKLIFAGRGKIKARWYSPTDRYPAYPIAVDQAFKSGKPVAIIGEKNELKRVYQYLGKDGIKNTPMTYASDRHILIEKPSENLVRQFFRLNK